MAVFESFDKTRIVYEQWGKHGTGPPVFLHHGFGANRFINWVATGMVDSLVDAGRVVVAHDARSHGESDKPRDPGRCGERLMARDLCALFDHLGAREVDLVGYSMGSVVVLLVAATDRRVRRVVVGGVGEGILECGGVDRRVLAPEVLRDALLAEDAASIDDPQAAGMRAIVDATHGDRIALATHCQTVHSAPIDLASIAAPTLVVAGSEDPLAAHPERLAGCLPDARLQLIPGDHLGAALAPTFKSAVATFLQA